MRTHQFTTSGVSATVGCDSNVHAARVSGEILDVAISTRGFARGAEWKMSRS